MMITLVDEVTQIGAEFYHAEIGLIASYPDTGAELGALYESAARYKFAADYPEFAFVQMAFMSPTRILSPER